MKLFYIASTVLLLLFTLPVHSVTDEQYATIKKLGQLNGIALNCGYLDETRKMKKALVLALPKTRQLGEAFERETNKGFLQLIESKSPCPTEEALSSQVDQAVEALNAAFVR